MIHKLVVERFGGPAGVRDQGLLISALFRPQTGYYESLPEMGAALFESLIINHPFHDGNKRVAFFGTDVFFGLNGFRFVVKPEEAFDYLIKLIESDNCNFEHLLLWIQKSIEPLEDIF